MAFMVGEAGKAVERARGEEKLRQAVRGGGGEGEEEKRVGV